MPMIFFSCIILEITIWNYIMKALLIIPYLAISAFVPWEKFSFSPSFLSNIIFDIIFIAAMLYWLKLRPNFSIKYEKGDISLVVATIILAIGSIFSLKSLNLGNPFSFIPALFINLVLIGPIVEEFIFRYIFNNFYSKVPWKRHLTSGFIFSTSHSLSLFFAPKAWYSFFYLQISYTFILGIICSMAFNKGKVTKPILIHIIFNFIFYLVTIQKLI